MGKDKWIGPHILNEFDEEPGGDLIGKTVNWGARGVVTGYIWGATHAALIEVPKGQSGLWMALRMAGRASIIAGASAGTLAGVLTVSQAVRGRNDAYSWIHAGLAAGFVMGVPSKRYSFGCQLGLLFAGIMAMSKLTESYKDPFGDPKKWMKEPPPERLSLLDENGKIIG